MATNPMPPPPGQTKTEDPWKNITPRDVLLDPAFHQLPHSTRKLILTKVWPEFTKANPADQDATIGVKYDDWLFQAQQTAPKEPGVFEKSWGAIKDTFAHISEQVPGVIQKAGEIAQKLPDWTDKAAESIYKSKVGLQEAAAQRKTAALEPPPGIPAPSEAFLKLAAGQPTRQPPKKTAEQFFSEQLPPPPAQPSPKPRGIDALGAEISDLNGKLEKQVLDLREKWPTGPDLKSKAQVDEFNAHVGEINANLAVAKEKSKKYMDFVEAAAFAGKRGVPPQDPELARTMARIKYPGAPEIGPMPAGEAEKFREETAAFEGSYGQIPLAEKILAAGMQGGASGLTFGAFEPQIGDTAAESLAFQAGSLAGIGPSYGFAGAVATPILGALRKIPIAGKWWGNLEKISKASVALKGAARTSTPASAEIAAKVIGKLADDIPEFEKALQFALQHPRLSEAATGVIQGVRGGTVMAAAGTIAALANGRSPKDALLHGFAVAITGELLRAAPGIRGLADKMKLDLTSPKLSQMATALQGKAGAIPAAERERIAFKQFLNEFMGRPQEEAIGRAFQAAVAYGVASAGVTAILTPGDIATRLKIGGESGLQTFIAIGAMHLPSVISAINARVGRPVEPAEAAIAYNNMTRDEKRQLVASISPEDLTKASENVNKMSGAEGTRFVREEISRQAAPEKAPTEGAATTPTEAFPLPPLGATPRPGEEGGRPLTQADWDAVFGGQPAGATPLPEPPPAPETVPLAKQFKVEERVVTPDGPGLITGIEKPDVGAQIATVQLDSGQPNTYPIPMLDSEPGQEIVPDKVWIPESTATLRAQVDSLIQGERPAVVLPPNINSEDFQRVTEGLDERWGRLDHPAKGTVFYDPSKITEQQVQEALDTGNDHLLMGAVEPLSDKTTTEIRVVGPDGVQIDLHKVSPENAREEVSRLAKTAPEGATIEILHDGKLTTSQEIDSKVGLPELDRPVRGLNPGNKIALGLGLQQEDYLAADPHIPQAVMPGSGEEDGYVYGIKQALEGKNLIDPGLGGSFMSAAGKGFAAARGQGAEEAPSPVPGPMQSWKVEVKTPGEEDWVNTPVRFATEKEANAYAADLGNRLFSNAEYRVLESEDPVKQVWDPEQARAIDVGGATPRDKLAPPPDNSLYIYSPFGVLPRETGGNKDEEAADRAIDFLDRALEALERRDPKAIQTEEYQRIKRDRDEIAWGRMPAVPFGKGAFHTPVLTLEEWPADTPSPRMLARAQGGDIVYYTKEQLDRHLDARNMELAAEESYDAAIATTEEDVLSALQKMFGNDEFVSKFIEANNNYEAFHKAMTSEAKFQKEVTLDLPDGTKLDILTVIGPHPQIFVERYKFKAGGTKLIAKTGKPLTRAIFEHFSEKMRAASAPGEGQIVLVQDQLDAIKRAIEKVKKVMPSGAPALNEIQLLRDYRVGHLAIDPKTETGVAFLRALVTHLSQSSDAADRYTGKVIRDHAPKIFTAETPAEAPEPKRPTPRSVAGLHLVAVRWAKEYGIEGADVWIYKNSEDAREAIKRIGTSTKPKNLISSIAPKGWTEDDIRRSLSNRWGISQVEIKFDSASETAEAEKTPAPAATPPGNPWEDKMPQGVHYLGPQDDANGGWVHIYSENETGTSFGLRDGDSLLEKVGAVRQKFAEDQRKDAVAREGTDHPRMPKPPFSYSRDLPNDPGLSEKAARMKTASMKRLQEQGLADKVIELAISGMNSDQITWWLIKLMPTGQEQAAVKMKVISTLTLKGIPKPDTADHKAWVERVALQIDDYNRETGTPPTMGAMPEPPPQPEEAPVLSFKKARIVPTRSGFKAEPIPDNLAPTTGETKAPRGKSWKYQVMIQGKWLPNDVRLGTREEANSLGSLKESNWTLVEEYRVVESEDKVNYRFDMNTGDLRAVEDVLPEPPAQAPAEAGEPEPPEPIEKPKDAETEAHRQKIKDFIKQKRRGAPKSYAMAEPGGEGDITVEDLMDNSDVIEAFVGIGQKYHATGASREAWHASMWHEAEDMEEGFGDIVEEILPDIWEAITGEEDYAGGRGGVYGLGGRTEAGPGAGGIAGVPLPGGPAGGPHGGIQPPPVGEPGEVEGAAGFPPGSGPPRPEDLGHGIQTRPIQTQSQGIGGVGVVPGAGSRPRDDGRFYRITADDHYGQGTAGQKIEGNIEAIRTLVELRASGEPATEEQKQKLVKYVGWGAFQTVFDENERYQNAKAYDTLRGLLTGEEWDHARASTRHAFYTDFDIAESMWYLLDQLGFKGNGTVVDPALGHGIFFGTAPDHIANSSSFLASELDLITAEIAQHLYPAAKIFARPYQKLEFPDGTIDIYIGNPPFDGRVADSRYPGEYLQQIHDYFFIKSLDKLREGGILAFVSSHGTMDKTGTAVRHGMMDRADLITAIRLPNTAFVDNAGTGVTTDIVVMKKRAPGDQSTGESFLNTVEIEKGLKINEYFARHPENMLGKMILGHGMQRDNQPICIPFGDAKLTRAREIAEMIRAIADKLPSGVYEEALEDKGRQAIIFAERFAPENVWEGQIVIDPETDKLMRNRHGSMVPIEEELTKAPANEKYIRELIAIRDALWTMFRVQLETEGEEVLEGPRQMLNQAYDRFVDSHGSIDNRTTKKLFGEDPTYFYLAALEKMDEHGKIKKSDIFSKRTMRPQMTLSALPEDPRQALLMVYAHRGFLDLDLMAKLTNKSAGDWEQELREQRFMFKDPQTGKLELPEEYLSGDIITKWEAAVLAAEVDAGYQKNVDSLKEVWPKPYPITGGAIGSDGRPLEIETCFGAPWIATSYYEEFARHLFGDNIYVAVSKDEGGKFKVSWKDKGAHRWEKRRQEVSYSLNHDTWGTRDYAATNLIADALNQQRPQVTKEDPKTGTRIRDKNATMAALRAQLKIKREFDTWAKTSAFAQQLQDEFNYRFNRIRLREYNGQHLTFEGMSTDMLRDGQLDPHQKNFVWRGIVDGRALLAHFVGGGKSYSFIALGMELRRMGLAQKCMFVEPKNVVSQFANDFALLYPGAKILRATESDFVAKNRKKLFARMAVEDWDAIIISIEQLQKIPISPPRLAITIKEELWALEQTKRSLDEMMDTSRGHRQNVKKIEKAIADKEAILEELSTLARDQTIFFDNLGVDYLFVDECQAFKNLGVSTKMGSMAGLTTEGNKRSLDLKAKVDFLLDKGRGRGVFLASGTPVSNSMTELYTMTRYVAPDLFRTAGIRMFDDWAANFGSAALDWEIGPDGRYKQKLRFSDFTNLPQLGLMFRTFADVINKEAIDLPIPKIKNGGPTIIELPMTEEAKPYFASFLERGKRLEGGQVDKTEDNWLKLTGDAKRASLDLRLLDAGAPDLPESKLNVAVKMIAEYHHQHTATLSTQIIFSEFKKFADKRFIYKEMKDKLVALGVKREEIANIHDYNRDNFPALYDSINKGKIRILLTTRKTSEGANMQERLGILYHLDAAWTPKDMEQREGRPVRQGNLHYAWGEPVEIIQFITKNSYDATLFKILMIKSKFIRTYLRGDTNVRSAGDPSGRVVMDYQMMSVIASGNPDALEKIQLENSIANLEGERSEYLNRIRRIKGSIEETEGIIPRMSAGMVGWRKVLDTYLANREPFAVTIDDKGFSDPDAAIEHMRAMKESGSPNPAIEKLQKEGKEVPEDMARTIPYEPKISGRHTSFEEAIRKINFGSDPENRKMAFTATIAGDVHTDRGEAEKALLELMKRVDSGKHGSFSVDITVFKIPIQVRVDRYTVSYGGQHQENRTKVLYNIANLETFEVTSVDAILGSAEHRFRNVPERISDVEGAIIRRTKELANMREEVSKPWEGDNDIRLKRLELVEVNQRLGISDGPKAEDVDPDDDVIAGELDEEETPVDEDEYPDQYESLMEAYSHIPRMSPEGLRRRDTYSQGTEETPTGDVFPEISKSGNQGEDRSEGGEIQLARRGIEVPELERVAELGPAFMFEAEATPEIIASLDAGMLPDTFREKLRLSGRVLADIIRVARFKTDRYEISDGISILSIYGNENGGLEVWDPTGFGRIEIPEIMWMIEQITKNPLKMTRALRRAVGHFVPAGEGGYIAIRPELAYDPKDHEVLARTIAHELGHAITFQPDFDMSRGNLIGRILSLHKFLKQTHGELKGLRNKDLNKDSEKLSNFWRPWDPALASSSYKKYRKSPEERIADFMSAVLLSPGTAMEMAPSLYRAFHRKLDLKPDVKEAYFKLRLMMQGTREEMLDHRLQRLGAMMKTAEEMSVALMIQTQLESSRWGEFRADYDDTRWDIKQRARKAIRAGVLSWEDISNPLIQWDEFPLKVRTDTYRHAEKVMKKVIYPMKKVGLDFHDLGGFMFLHRSATERANMMNPIFGPGREAVSSLEHLRRVIGDVKYKHLEAASATYHDIRWYWVVEGLRSGLYPQEVFDNKFLPNKYYYGKYTPLEYLKDYVSPTVKSQIGYAGPIANTFIETLKMDMSLIRLVALNDAKVASVEFLKEFYPGEVRLAPIINPGEKMKRFKEPPKGFDLVEIMRNGSTVGYHVDKFIAESLNTVSPDAARGLTHYAQQFNSKFYWPIVILYNMGFSGWGNPWRDFWTNYTKLPLKTAVVGDLFQLLMAYKKAAPHAWEWMKGREDEVTRRMIDSYAYALPLSEVVVDEMDSLNLVLKKAGFIRDIKELHKGVAAKAFNTISKITKVMEMALAFSEMTGKLAGAYIRQDAGETGKQLAFNIRNYTSTPNFDVKGHKTRTTNSWFPFSNIIKEGWKSTYLTATEPETRSGFWFRMSKLLGLVMLSIAAEHGFLGEDLEKFFGSISGHTKNNYFCLGYGPPDEEGRVTVLTLPKDEGTRLLGAILRETMNLIKGRDPQAFAEEMGTFLFSQTPSLTPALKVPIVNALWFGRAYNVPDTFRMTPILPELIAKAQGLPAAKRMLQWSINEFGLGQYTTYDPEKKSFYQWWTQTDPTVGKLVGRMFRVTNYGITEQANKDVAKLDREAARQSLEFRENPAIAELYSMNYKAMRDNKLLKAATSKGMSYHDAIKEHPEAEHTRALASAIQRLARMRKVMNLVKEDKSLSDDEKKARTSLITKQMEEMASGIISGIKGKAGASYPRMPEPPGVNEGLMPPPGVVKSFPGLPEPPR